MKLKMEELEKIFDTCYNSEKQRILRESSEEELLNILSNLETIDWDYLDVLALTKNPETSEKVWEVCFSNIERSYANKGIFREGNAKKVLEHPAFTDNVIRNRILKRDKNNVYYYLRKELAKNSKDNKVLNQLYNLGYKQIQKWVAENPAFTYISDNEDMELCNFLFKNGSFERDSIEQMIKEYKLSNYIIERLIKIREYQPLILEFQSVPRKMTERFLDDSREEIQIALIKGQKLSAEVLMKIAKTTSHDAVKYLIAESPLVTIDIMKVMFVK